MPKVSFSSREVTPETFSDCIHPLHTDLLDASNDISRRDALIRLQKLVTGMTAANLALALAPARTSAQEKEEAPLLTFDGKDDAVIIPTLQYRGHQPICIDTVINPASIKDDATIVGNQHSGGVGLCLSRGKAEFSVHNGKQYLRVQSDDALKEGQEVRITAVCDHQALRLYVDGALQKNVFPWSGKHRPSKHPLYIGADPDAAGFPQHHFAGAISTLRISAIARDRTDIWKKHPFGTPDRFDAFYLNPESGEDQSRFRHRIIWQGKDE